VIYKTRCRNSDHVDIRETGRPLGTTVKEHPKEVNNITAVFTRAEKTQ